MVIYGAPSPRKGTRSQENSALDSLSSQQQPNWALGIFAFPSLVLVGSGLEVDLASGQVCLNDNSSSLCSKPSEAQLPVFVDIDRLAPLGGVAQLGERCVRNAEVGSSILLLSTMVKKFEKSKFNQQIWLKFPVIC